MHTLADVGEKAAVAAILGRLKSTTAVGPGDDAAAMEVGGKYVVVSTDIVSRFAHLPGAMGPRDIGWFVAAVNLSDVAAMGARPLGVLLSFCLPRDYLLQDLEEIMAGARDCVASVGTEILGGDTKESRELVISGTALGEVEKERILLRRGAKEGDLLAVTGTMGLAAAGFAAVMNGLDVPAAVDAFVRPKPRIREGMALSASGAATSAMDVTDGLAYSVHELSRQSGVGFAIDWDAIPVRPEVRAIAEAAGEREEDMVLHYGGDYELLFTLRPDMLDRARGALGDGFSVIGRAEGKKNVLIRDGKVSHLESRGYEHFRG
jgi:thiamine-monophosphate kinase